MSTVKTYKDEGKSLYDQLLQYSKDRMQVDPKYKRDVLHSLAQKRAAHRKRKAEQKAKLGVQAKDTWDKAA